MNIITVHRLKKRRGFTILEAVAASAILAVGLTSMAVVFYDHTKFIVQNKEKAIATLAAQEEIENIRGMAFDSILALSQSFTSSGFAYLRNPTGTVTVDNIYSTSDIRRVSVTVTWTSASGGTLNKKLVTLVTRNGIDKQ